MHNNSLEIQTSIQETSFSLPPSRCPDALESLPVIQMAMQVGGMALLGFVWELQVDAFHLRGQSSTVSM